MTSSSSSSSPPPSLSPTAPSSPRVSRIAPRFLSSPFQSRSFQISSVPSSPLPLSTAFPSFRFPFLGVNSGADVVARATPPTRSTRRARPTLKTNATRDTPTVSCNLLSSVSSFCLLLHPLRTTVRRRGENRISRLAERWNRSILLLLCCLLLFSTTTTRTRITIKSTRKRTTTRQNAGGRGGKGGWKQVILVKASSSFGEEDVDGINKDSSSSSSSSYRQPSNQSLGASSRLESVHKKPLFTLGVFADAQYADKENGTYGTRNKYFRDAKERLKNCLNEFSENAHALACVINLGDLYDGYNEDSAENLYFRDASSWSEEVKARNVKEFNEMVEITEKSLTKDLKLVSVLGNHDMAVTREVFKQKMNFGEDDYYKVELPRNWVLLCLDTTDMNPRYVDENSEAWKEGHAWLASKTEEFKKRNAKPWSGGIASVQFNWLKEQVDLAEKEGKKVIVCSHNALAPGSAREGMVAWNADVISSYFESKSETVKVCVAGHDHPGGYIQRGNVHYVTIEAMLEADCGTSYGYLEVYEHECILRGVGACKSRRMRTSEWGRFTGIANFGMLTGDIDVIDSNDPEEEKLADWINDQLRTPSSASSSSDDSDDLIIRR
mmetsp:Transcript_2558/g.8199  ORF Transcript_2558/g.8199 Transcript_2558/m.8199 type:complete len:609 (-) Transcript_2558:63-1889(-)